MKIVLATPIYPPEIGGPAIYIKELCERIHKQHDVTVVAYTDVKTPFPNTRLISVSKRRRLPVRLIKFFISIWNVSKNADLIYVQNAMAAGLPVALVSILRGKPYVLKFVGDEAWERASQNRKTDKRLEEFLRDPEGGFKIRLMMWIQGFVLRHATVVTTPSKYLLEEIIRAYGVKKARGEVNYNAAEEPQILPFKAERKKHQIATTARLVAWKGISGIIKALSIVKKNFPDATLVVAGDGPEMSNLKELAKTLKVDSDVKFLGNISRAETWQLRKSSDIYVLNSTYEGLPHTVLTSFAAEIPTIATNISGTNEAVYHNKTGLLIEPGDDQGLAESIELLFNNKKLADDLVRNGSIMLKEKFSWESHVEKLNSIFKSVLSEPHHKV